MHFVKEQIVSLQNLPSFSIDESVVHAVVDDDDDVRVVERIDQMDDVNVELGDDHIPLVLHHHSMFHMLLEPFEMWHYHHLYQDGVVLQAFDMLV